MMEGPSAESEEKREPASDIKTAAVDSLKVLDPERPIREADLSQTMRHVSDAREPRLELPNLHLCGNLLNV